LLKVAVGGDEALSRLVVYAATVNSITISEQGQQEKEENLCIQPLTFVIFHKECARVMKHMEVSFSGWWAFSNGLKGFNPTTEMAGITSTN
jgi:hypothetical protein